MSFHDYNPFTGRLKRSTQSQPLYPVSPRALETTEAPVMMYDSIKTKPVGTKSPTNGNYSTLSPKMAALYKKYQADLSKPSYLLAGRRDKILFGITAVWTLANTGICLYSIIKNSK